MPRVLVVDDEEAFCALMATHLRRREFEVESASDGPEALKQLSDNGPFEVMVCDLMMPGMSGLELLRQAKQDDSWLEVIVITASNDLEMAVSAMREEGAFDYLLKPLGTLNELSLAVQRAQAHRALRVERQMLSDRLAIEASRLQAVVYNTGDGILACDAGGKITVANPAAQTLLGQAESIGLEASQVLPDPLRGLLENWRTLGERQPAVVEMAWPEGRAHLVSLAAILDAEDVEAGWVMLMRDITHLRNLDELKMRTLTEAAGRIRLPLAQAISQLAELGLSPSVSNSGASETVYQLVKLLGRVQHWMDELLALVRIEAGIGVERAEVSLGEVINDDLRSEFEDTFQDSALKLVVHIEEDLPSVRVDPSLMEKMIQALLRRAAARSGYGGEITVNVRGREAQVWIEVHDDGLRKHRETAEDEILERIENRAFGSELEGLGLEMVRVIVGRLGGQVWVQGQGALGNTIAISLPAVVPLPAGVGEEA